MITIAIPPPRNETEYACLEWWRALDPGIRQVFMQAVWEIEGCESPDELEPHQRNPRYTPMPTPWQGSAR
jgi:hypothetical protein